MAAKEVMQKQQSKIEGILEIMATQKDCRKLRQRLINSLDNDSLKNNAQNRLLIMDCILMIEAHEALIDLMITQEQNKPKLIHLGK